MSLRRKEKRRLVKFYINYFTLIDIPTIPEVSNSFKRWLKSDHKVIVRGDTYRDNLNTPVKYRARL